MIAFASAADFFCTLFLKLNTLLAFPERAAWSADPGHALLECQAVSHAQYRCQIWTKSYMDRSQWGPDILANR